ncbi:MAG: hypothetical protein AAB780_00560 [Patescibacteria group bacterium]
MYRKIIHFVKYNNAFTIIFVTCFFGFGITYAASPTVRESVYASEQAVVSIDNSLIVSADLDNFNFNLRINSITDDAKNYYVVYTYQTLAIEDGFWREKEIEKTLTVSKEALGDKDLGLYVARELGENINYELSYLKRVKKLEKENGESRKVVTTEYSGLIGKLLDPKEQVIEGYNPVIPEPVPEVATTAETNPAAVIVSIPHPKPSQTATPTPTPTSASTPTTTSQQTESTSEDIVNEQLVQDVVEQLLQDNSSSTPVTTLATTSLVATEASSTPETVSEPVIEASSTPETTSESVASTTEVTPPPATVPESVIEASSTPEMISEPTPAIPDVAPPPATVPEPVTQDTSTPETVSEPTQ